MVAAAKIGVETVTYDAKIFTNIASPAGSLLNSKPTAKRK